jgi:hypothetical protein
LMNSFFVPCKKASTFGLIWNDDKHNHSFVRIFFDNDCRLSQDMYSPGGRIMPVVSGRKQVWFFFFHIIDPCGI